MNAAPAFEVFLTESALTSLRNLDPSRLADVNGVLRELGAYVQKYPSRIHLNTNGRSVYQHPNPPQPDIEIAYLLDTERGIIRCEHVTALLPRVFVFVSYSHKNKKFLENEFRPYITSLVEQGLIKFWDDGDIEAGADWEETLQSVLRSAKAAVLLVTQDFLISQYVRTKELPVLEEGFKAGTIRVDWIHVDEAQYEKHWFGRLQSLCDPSVPLMALRVPKRKKRLKEICKELERKLFELP